RNPAGELAIAHQTHFGQEVKIVLAHSNQTWPVALQRLLEPGLRFGERRVKQRDSIALPAQTRRSEQGLQRRIRLHFAHLFAVAVKVVRMGEKYVYHWLCP